MRRVLQSLYMLTTKNRILELFQTLPPTDQRALVEQLSETAQGGSFYDRMSTDQRAQLDEGIMQAECGDTIPAADAFDDLATRFGFSRA